MFAIDGVKLPSNASRHRSGARAEFTQRAEKLEAAAQTMLDRHRATDAAELEPDVAAKTTARIANISRPISPCPSHTASTVANTCAMSSRSVFTKWPIVVKCGAVMPHSAMTVRIRRRAVRVVAEAGVEVRQIHCVNEQIIQRVLERAGQ